MKTFIKALTLTVILIGCKKAVEQPKPLPKNYQDALIRVQAIDNDNATTTSQLIIIKIEQ